MIPAALLTLVLICFFKADKDSRSDAEIVSVVSQSFKNLHGGSDRSDNDGEATVVINGRELIESEPTPIVRGQNGRLFYPDPVRKLRGPMAGRIFAKNFMEARRGAIRGDLTIDEHTASAIEASFDQKSVWEFVKSDAEFIELPLNADTNVLLRVDEVVERGDRTHTLIGSVKDHPTSLAIMVFHDGAVSGSIAYYDKGEHYQYASAGNGDVAIRLLDRKTFTASCGQLSHEGCDHSGPCLHLASEGVSSELSSEEAAPGEAEEQVLTPPSPAPEPGSLIMDTVVGYSVEARVNEGGTAAMEAKIIQSIDRLNFSMGNSEIVGSFVSLLATIEEPDYVYPGAAVGMDDEFFSLNNTSNPELNTISDLKQLLGADHNAFIMKQPDQDAGIAAAPSDSMIVASTYMTSNRMTFAHEFGHTVGCYHAWGDTSGDVATNVYRWGWRLTTDGGSNVRTIMAYTSSGWNDRIPNFSNPDVLYGGVRTGQVDGYDATGDPASDQTLVSGGRIGTAGSGFDGTNPALGARNAHYFSEQDDVMAARATRTSLAVVEPGRWVTWNTGQTQTIFWYGGDHTDSTQLDLYKGGVFHSTIATGFNASLRWYDWQVPAGLESGRDYTIRITLNGTAVADSEEFFIENPNNPLVNTAPTDLVLSNSVMSQTDMIGKIVGSLVITDAYDIGPFTYEFVAGSGSTDNGAFTLSGANVVASSVPDFLAQSSYSIRVKATDPGGLSIERAFVLHVAQPLEGLVFADDFEPSSGSTDVTDNITNGGHDGSKWQGSARGFGSGNKGVVDESAGDFTDLAGEQAYTSRAINAGMTTQEGVIGSLTAGVTYTVSFDVALDGYNSGNGYHVSLVTFNGADRFDVRGDRSTGATGATSLLAESVGTYSGTDYVRKSFQYTATGNESVIGHDVALRLFHFNGGAMIDNVVVQATSAADTTSPMLTSSGFAENVTGSAVVKNSLIEYTVLFSEDMDALTVDAADFGNAGTAAISIGAITEIAPGTFTVEVTPTTAGTIQLQVVAGASLADVAGNALDSSVAIADSSVVSVIDSNSAPVWASNPLVEASASQLSFYSSSLADDVTDADGNSLVFSLQGGPAWLSLSSNGDITGTPSNNDTGLHVFSVNVTDGIADPVNVELQISIGTTNSQPVFAQDPIQMPKATENLPYSGSIAGAATDADGETILYAYVSGPNWLQVYPNGDLSGTPLASHVGDNEIVVSASDGIAAPVQATLLITVDPAFQGGVMFADNFEPGPNSYGGTSDDVSSYNLNNTSQKANGVLWQRANDGFGAERNGMVDETENAGANFTDPTGEQAYAFRYTNSGLTSKEGMIGSLTAGTTIVVEFDVVTDGHYGGTAYDASLVLFDPGALRNQVQDTTKGTAAVLATAIGNASGANYETITFSYTVGAPVVDNNGELAGSNTAYLESLLDKDIALRFNGATSSANIDNVVVSINGAGSPGPDTTPPTIASTDILDDQGGANVRSNDLVTYIMSFSEDMDEATVVASDFSNAGTAPIAIGAITETSPGVFSIGVIPSDVGTLQLQISAGAALSDVAGNALDTTAAIVDDTVITVDPPLVSVPMVVGLDQTTAESNIVSAGLVVGTVTSQYDAGVATGDVISQSPSGGASIDEGSAVDLVVSLGPPQTIVPNVVGQSQATAETNIVAASLAVGSVTSQYDAGVPAGNVISQSPSGGVTVDEGSSVDLVVSLGAPQTTVPNVVGQPQATAEANILAADLVVGTVTTQNDETVPSGDVISQSPSGGAAVNTGTAVDLVVSSGPATTTVPNVVGQSQASAETNLIAANLVVGSITEQYSSSVAAGNVISQEIAAGTDVAEGTAVDLVVSLGEEPSANLVRTTVTAVTNSSWTTVDLGQTYASSVIVATPIYGAGMTIPVVTRINNVTASGFDLKLDRADGLTGPVSYDVSVVAVEEGVYTQSANGVTMEAVKFTSTITGGKSSWNGELRSYQNTYTNPVVVGQVMSHNDTDWSVFWSMGASRQNPADATNLAVGKHVGEDRNSNRANETIGYIVIESGAGTINGVSFEAGVGSDSVRGLDDSASPYTYNLTGNLTTASAAAVSQSAMSSNEGSWAVLSGSNPLSPTSIGLHCIEDQMWDSDMGHTTEQVSYIVFE